MSESINVKAVFIKWGGGSISSWGKFLWKTLVFKFKIFKGQKINFNVKVNGENFFYWKVTLKMFIFIQNCAVVGVSAARLNFIEHCSSTRWWFGIK